MSTYETITVDQLANRAHTAYQRGSMGIPETPDTFFAVQYWLEDKGCWWVGAESTDQAEAEKVLAQWQALGRKDVRIVIVTTKQEEEKATMEIGHTSIGYYDDEKEEWVEVEVEINLSDPDYPQEEEEALSSVHER